MNNVFFKPKPVITDVNFPLWKKVSLLIGLLWSFEETHFQKFWWWLGKQKRASDRVSNVVELIFKFNCSSSKCSVNVHDLPSKFAAFLVKLFSRTVTNKTKRCQIFSFVLLSCDNPPHRIIQFKVLLHLRPIHFGIMVSRDNLSLSFLKHLEDNRRFQSLNSHC